MCFKAGNDPQLTSPLDPRLASWPLGRRLAHGNWMQRRKAWRKAAAASLPLFRGPRHRWAVYRALQSATNDLPRAINWPVPTAVNRCRWTIWGASPIKASVPGCC